MRTKAMIVATTLWAAGCGYSEAEMQVQRDKLMLLQTALDAANADRADRAAEAPACVLASEVQ